MTNPWFITQGRAVRKNPNGPPGIIRGDVPADTLYVGVEWHDGHTSMQPVGDLIEWQPKPGEVVVTLSGWIDFLESIDATGRVRLMRAAGRYYLHQIRPAMKTDRWIYCAGDRVRVLVNGQVGVVQPTWHPVNDRLRVLVAGDPDPNHFGHWFCANELAPMGPGEV